MMGIETMKSVSPKTVDRSTLVQRSSIRLDPAAPQEDQLRRDGHDNGRLSGTLSERSLIYEQSESFRPVLWTSD